MKIITTEHSVTNSTPPKKIIFVSDLHGSRLCKPFFETFLNDASYDDTHFVLTGDLFDRGAYSDEVFEVVRKLHEEKRLTLSIGNHEGMFIFSQWLRPGAQSNFAKRAAEVIPEIDRNALYQIYKEQFEMNGWAATTFAFAQAYGPHMADAVDDAVDFLSQFGLYAVDPAGNLIVHWGLPITNGLLVGEEIGGKYVSGFDYVKALDEWFRNLDTETLYKLTARDKSCGPKLLADMKRNGAIWDEKALEKNFNYVTDALPTWLDNSIYIRYPETIKTLRAELDRNNFGRLICWHWMNGNPTFGTKDDQELVEFGDTVLRLDRSFIGLDNFWYAILDAKTKKILDLGDSYYFLNSKREVVEGN